MTAVNLVPVTKQVRNTALNLQGSGDPLLLQLFYKPPIDLEAEEVHVLFGELCVNIFVVCRTI